EQFTKWSYEVRRAEEAPVAVRRALKLAQTPPTGPVFLSLPMDLMTQIVDDNAAAAPHVHAAATAGADTVARAAALLAGAARPLALHRELAASMTDAQRAAAHARLGELGAQRATLTDQARSAAEAEAGRTPISPAYLMHTLGSLVARDAIVVDESATSLGHVLRYFPMAAPDTFFGGKTGTLGWAMGAALGVQLACPGRKVV